MDAFLSRIKHALFNPKEGGSETKQAAEAAPSWVSAIIGLGNPGDAYRNTRHNIGFQLVDYLATNAGRTWKNEKRFNAEISDCLLSGRGGPGGHKGMSSILQHGGKNVVRLRLGIGHKSHPGMDLADHVLGRFTAEDLQLVQDKMENWAQALELVVDKGPAQAMNFINRKSN